MPSIRSRPAVGIALILAAGLIALPACKKKPDGATNPDAPAAGKDALRPGSSWLHAPDPNAPEPGMPALPQTPLYSKGAPGVGPIRGQSQNNLKQIIMAMHSFHDAANGRGFPIGVYDKSGQKLGLSWRVALLPLLGEESLMREFNLDESWDSEHNKKLIGRIPKVYVAPSGDATGYTFYRSFSGPDTVMPAPKPGTPGKVALGLKLLAITDGVANTMAVVEAAKPVIWTKPDELEYDPKGAVPRVGGGVFEDGFNAAFYEGSVRFLLTKSVNEKTMRALITANGGEIPDI